MESAASYSYSYTTTPEERAEAAEMRTGQGGEPAAGAGAGSGAGAAALGLPAAEIDVGTFKYVLVEVYGAAEGPPVHLVRGKNGCPYHKDVAAPLVRELQQRGLRYEVLGGGRIQHDAESKRVLVYGYSMGFPWMGAFRHDITAEVLRQSGFGTDAGYFIETSDEGY